MNDFDTTEPPHDELDSLLRQWHSENSAAAIRRRDEILEKAVPAKTGGGRALRGPRGDAPAGRLYRLPYWFRAAAVIAMVATFGLLFYSLQPRPALADSPCMVPDGGRLDAFGADHQLVGPCPLKHTDVVADVAGFFTRVTLTQTYTNTYAQKIEAVYTFPMSHRSAVDRMRMTVRAGGAERIVEGEVKERQLARQMYHSARNAGFVASLLEQERPNIFTQSVANIEPGAEVQVEISYVETLQSRDGTYTFDFPMVVGPRYIPGHLAPSGSMSLPPQLNARNGVILLAPAQLRVVSADGPAVPAAQLQSGVGDGGNRGAVVKDASPPAAVEAIKAPAIADPPPALPGAGGGSGTPPLFAAPLLAEIERATAIQPPSPEWIARSDGEHSVLRAAFIVKYVDGSEEPGWIFADGTGCIGTRWFWTSGPAPREISGTGFSSGTNQVPDAALITPMPVRPPERAGHDLSMTVNIDSGGPAVTDLKSDLHRVVASDRGAGKTTVKLETGKTIPNRDFSLSWKLSGGSLAEGFLAQRAESPTGSPDKDGTFLLYVLPPARPESASIRPRELVFVMDTSGSMSGFPIEKSKEVINRLLQTMRPSDTFNIITFSGDEHILWKECKPANPQTIAEAMAFVNGQRGGGGTEMMKAIEAALVQTANGPAGALTPAQMADLPADGREVELTAPYSAVGADGNGKYFLKVTDSIRIPLVMSVTLPTVFQPEGVQLSFHGRWKTERGERIYDADMARFANQPGTGPMRIALFFTDGYVGNDQEIVAAVQRNARSTRVFSFGIGNAVNRSLLDGMAKAGRGAVDYVFLNTNVEESMKRFTARVTTPVLTDIEVAFNGIEVNRVTPTGGTLPDLFDQEPLIVVGRYSQPGHGSVRIKGITGAGPWERTLQVDLPALESKSAMLPTIWARKQVEQILAPHLDDVQKGVLAADVRGQVVKLGEEYRLLTPYTSFVAIEKARVTIAGAPVLVPVPIELPEGTRWEGFFGGDARTVLATLKAPRPPAVRKLAATYGYMGDGVDRRAGGKGKDAGLTAPESGLSGINFSASGGSASVLSAETRRFAESPAERTRGINGTTGAYAGGGGGGGGFPARAGNVAGYRRDLQSDADKLSVAEAGDVGGIDGDGVPLLGDVPLLGLNFAYGEEESRKLAFPWQSVNGPEMEGLSTPTLDDLSESLEWKGLQADPASAAAAARGPGATSYKELAKSGDPQPLGRAIHAATLPAPLSQPAPTAAPAAGSAGAPIGDANKRGDPTPGGVFVVRPEAEPDAPGKRPVSPPSPVGAAPGKPSQAPTAPGAPIAPAPNPFDVSALLAANPYTGRNTERARQELHWFLLTALRRDGFSPDGPAAIEFDGNTVKIRHASSAADQKAIIEGLETILKSGPGAATRTISADGASISFFDLRPILSACHTRRDVMERIGVEVAALESGVEPQSWVDNGGSVSTWSGYGGVLVVRTSPEVMTKVAEFMTPRLTAPPVAQPPIGATFTPEQLDRLWSRMDVRLILLSLQAQVPDSERAEASIPVKTEGLTIDAGVATIIASLTATDSSALESLRSAGASIQDVSKDSPVVVAKVPIEKLTAVALLDAVRRVDPLAKPRSANK